MAYGKITKKQAEILNYLKSEIINKGYPPSVREICNAVGLRSTSSVLSGFSSLISKYCRIMGDKSAIFHKSPYPFEYPFRVRPAAPG